MDKKLNKSHTDDHNQLPSDEVTRNKIDKHLSNIDDTISEEDIKNINTVTGTENAVSADNAHDKLEADEIINDGNNNPDDKPEDEAPTPWEVLEK